ncbi:hypothetical protein DSM112329_04406 [Paraconexibacter sp. AEG42_29]|uniref:Glycosyltransferase RgtA/B/C/D-like domain-containing protein n=1 Tax=Paraconexibacter sp. AEG42_29 TaxID=2997339 RepID=A0AAU7B0P7_9ACTN
MRRPAILGALATIVGVTLLLRLVYGEPFLNYDASYSLLWAHDIAHGRTPDYQGFIAPTPHPLQTFVSLLALPLGDATTTVLAWIVMVCFGGIVYVTYRLGRELFSVPVGALAAIVVLTRPAFGRNAEFAYQDIPFALFVAWALLLEVRSPRRGAPVLVLLTLAGLLRPEAWVLAAAYWLWLVWGRGTDADRRAVRESLPGLRRPGAASLRAVLGGGARVVRGIPRADRPQLLGLAVLGASGGILWAISDAAITGDFLHSFHGTSDLAEQLGRPRSPAEAPFRTAKFLGFTLREPLIVGVPVGCVFVALLARRGLILIGVAAAMVAFFLLSTIGGLPLIARYVLTPSLFLAIVYASGCLGWMQLPAGSRERRIWQRVGLATLALSVLFLPKHVDLVDEVRTKVTNSREIQTDLKDIADSSVVRQHLDRCGHRLTTYDHPEVPPLRYYLGTAPGSVRDRHEKEYPVAQLLLMPVDESVERRYYQGVPPLVVPRGYREVFRSTYWRLMASPDCPATRVVFEER